MNNSDPFVIQMSGLAMTYGGAQVLQPLDLHVREHSICGFLGPNGAGKTTTIKLQLGLSRPTGGSGRVFGLDIQTHNDEIRRRVGYQAQDPRFYEYLITPLGILLRDVMPWRLVCGLGKNAVIPALGGYLVQGVPLPAVTPIIVTAA